MTRKNSYDNQRNSARGSSRKPANESFLNFGDSAVERNENRFDRRHQNERDQRRSFGARNEDDSYPRDESRFSDRNQSWDQSQNNGSSWNRDGNNPWTEDRYYRGMGSWGARGFDPSKLDQAPYQNQSPYKGVQSYTGRGPKGYKRSDERIKEDVCECLARSSSVDASEIEVNVKECCVTLTGSVGNREEKREAERLIENLRGVEDVVNELKLSKKEDSLYGSNESYHQDRFSSGKNEEMGTKNTVNSKFDSKGSSFSSHI